MTQDAVPLAEAVEALRQELDAAVRQADGQQIRFDLGPVEVEFTAVVSTTGKAGAKASFKVLGVGVEAEGGGDHSRERTHKLKFTLTPVVVRPGAQPENVRISGKTDSLGSKTPKAKRR